MQVLLKTPQKTPKSILKQPGSECKRRRVLLISPEKTPPKNGHDEVESDPEDEVATGLKNVDTNGETCLVEAQPCFKPAPPRTPNIRGTPQTRVGFMNSCLHLFLDLGNNSDSTHELFCYYRK